MALTPEAKVKKVVVGQLKERGPITFTPSQVATAGAECRTLLVALVACSLVLNAKLARTRQRRYRIRT